MKEKNILFAIVLAMLALAAITVTVEAQDPPEWPSPIGQVKSAIDGRPRAFAERLLEVCTQEQINALDAWLFPPLNDDEKAAELEAIRVRVRRLDDADLLQRLDSRLEAIRERPAKTDTLEIPAEVGR